MRLLADAQDADELMLASVERESGVRLHPDRQVQDIVIDGAASLEQLADMSPLIRWSMLRHSSRMFGRSLHETGGMWLFKLQAVE
jgi:hypothetical protein